MKIIKRLFFSFSVLVILAWLYTNSLIGVDQQAKSYYNDLKSELKRQGHKTHIFAISGRRWKLDNYLLTKIGGAASESKHRSGQAIDIIVLDVNADGQANSADVDLVLSILDSSIIKGKGGIGTYKSESGFFNQQMIHFDCRGERARWDR